MPVVLQLVMSLMRVTRTAFKAMDTCLTINGIELDFDTVEAGDMMIKATQGIIDERELADWLRILAQQIS